MRFKTKEQIEQYLKAVKDYYDAFKIKLVRRQDSLDELYNSGSNKYDDDNNNNNNNNNNNELDELLANNHEKSSSVSNIRFPFIRQRYRMRRPTIF